MAIISYTDPITKDRTEFVAVVCDENNIKQAAASLRAMVAWFEHTTGVLMFPDSPEKYAKMTAADKANGAAQPGTQEKPATVESIEKASKPRRKRRTKAEIEAEKERVRHELDDPADPAPVAAADPFGAAEEAPVADHPTNDDLVAAGRDWLADSNNTMDDLRQICEAAGAPKMSMLSPEGRSAVMAKLMETANG